MTLVTARFIKDNLPTPDQQLGLLKAILECGNRELDNVYNFIFVPHVEYLSTYVLKIGCLSSLRDNINWYDDAKTYVNKNVEKILIEIARFVINQCKERNTDTVYILEPEALLEKTYIEVSQIENSIELRCVVGICFNLDLARLRETYSIILK